MTYWAQLLHFYQPPTQTHGILKRVTEESYRPLLAVLREYPAARIAININAVLTEMLSEHGFGDVLQSLRELGERGQIEFVGSGKFHPILPLLRPGERQRSIAGNAETNRALIGESFAPTGFFPPEMCYDAGTIPDIANSGHSWAIMSGVACPAPWPASTVYRACHDGHEIAVLFRDDILSNKISFRETNPTAFLDGLESLGHGHAAYVVTAMDAETYGHHIRGWEREFLATTYSLLAERNRAHPSHPAEAAGVHMVTPGEIVALFPAGPEIEPLASSWSTTRDDIAASNPFPLWHAPGNRMHALQWEYVDHCRALLSIANLHAADGEAGKFAEIARERFEPALHSCQFWWASRRPMWDVTMIHRGFLLLNTVLLNASHAVWLSGAPTALKDEARWRTAAANELRAHMEREMFAGGRA